MSRSVQYSSGMTKAQRGADTNTDNGLSVLEEFSIRIYASMLSNKGHQFIDMTNGMQAELDLEQIATVSIKAAEILVKKLRKPREPVEEKPAPTLVLEEGKRYVRRDGHVSSELVRAEKGTSPAEFVWKDSRTGFTYTVNGRYSNIVKDHLYDLVQEKTGTEY